MDIIIQAPGITPSDSLKDFINEKLAKLEPIAHKLIRADVTLFSGHEGTTENAVCEIRLEMPGNDPFVKKTTASFEQSVVECVDALQNILRKNKEKLTDQRSAGSPEFS